MKKKSKKSFGLAVSLSSVLGLIGLQHFYLGRYLEGAIDVALTAGWIYALIVENFLLFGLFLGLDLLHSLVTTIMLLTGTFKDGEGAYVCYPGQNLNKRREIHARYVKPNSK